ncbi:hypothetical protein AWB80_08440 [Caballeronia pedi]|uniref:Uncharacterized protein n=1 Tax=Caballeronia pedi TaxID=1777141 RepID=A0A158E7F5_9BURK|nr:hypothetical protein [Caballeronia pedi]SAL02789.1 hypothetical protein AWB80_08440 [Caballeronia pedi]
MNQSLEQYFRDALTTSGAIDFRVRASVTDNGVAFYIHPADRSGVTADFKVEGNTLRPAGGIPWAILAPGARPPILGEDGALLAVPAGTAEDLAASVAP